MAHFEDLGVNGKIVKWNLKETGWLGVDWIHLAQEKDNWHVIVNKVRTFEFQKYVGNYWVTISYSSRNMPHGVSKLVVCLVGWPCTDSNCGNKEWHNAIV
jgi:hypothetical protein